jgi:hypothetical protein
MRGNCVREEFLRLSEIGKEKRDGRCNICGAFAAFIAQSLSQGMSAEASASLSAVEARMTIDLERELAAGTRETRETRGRSDRSDQSRKRTRALFVVYVRRRKR